MVMLIVSGSIEMANSGLKILLIDMNRERVIYHFNHYLFLVSKISNLFVIYVKCGGNTTFVVTEERFVYAFGSNLKGRLAMRQEGSINIPIPTEVDKLYF